jgi:hypothetical protein
MKSTNEVTSELVQVAIDHLLEGNQVRAYTTLVLLKAALENQARAEKAA